VPGWSAGSLNQTDQARMPGSNVAFFLKGESMHARFCVVAFMMGSILPLASWAAPSARKDYPVRPVPFTRVQFADPFWSPRMQINRRVSIPAAFEQCEKTGRIDNFKIAGDLMEGRHRGDFGFDDTDPYKVIEGASYALMVQKDDALATYLDRLIGYFAAAQEADGYLYTTLTSQACDTVKYCHPIKERWDNLQHSHELYNAGHMYEAAVAHYQATGERNFLDVALRNADLICRTFNPDGLSIPPGHEEIELGLVKLYRVTGEEKYLKTAKFFMDIRGREINGRTLWGPYNQDHKPVTEQDEVVGHAVRAAYLFAAMTDIAALCDDAAYRTAVDRLWNSIVTRKLYLTGGIGARRDGESFGGDYELPNAAAYNETCAAIALVNWAHRMFLLHGDAAYMDVLERTLYNGLIVGVSLDGTRFFYPNPLASDGKDPFNQGSAERQPWFGCACCPGNVTRFVASVPGLAYAHTDDSLIINLYAAGRADIQMGGQTVHLDVTTQYPWDGRVQIKVQPEESGQPFGLKLRIPGWTANRPVPSDLYHFLQADGTPVMYHVNGQPVEPVIEKGYAVIRRAWESGDTVLMHMSMPVQRVVAHEKVEADAGRVALQRGPIVYCIEGADNGNESIAAFKLSDTAKIATAYKPDLLGGIVTITIEQAGSDQPVTAIPYNVWCNRGANAMAVWVGR